MQTKIKTMIEDNLSDIYAISQEQFKDESWTFSQFKECTQNKEYITYALIVKGEIASFLISQNLVDSINLLLLATKSKFKNNGFATLLMKKLITESKTKIWLEVKDNSPVIELYKRLGFSSLYERKNYYKDGTTALVMER